MRIIKEINTNINQNNINGSFSISNFKIFFKIQPQRETNLELEAYNLVTKHYKTSEKIFDITDEIKGIIGYKYCNIVKKNSGLLVDFFADNLKLDASYINILQKYKEVFNKTIIKSEYNNCKILFDDRVEKRLKKNYQIIENKYIDKKYCLNGIEIFLYFENVNNMHTVIKNYFRERQDTWNVVSQCDPNDLNICIDGTLLDYTAGGVVPLMGEFATFLCYNLIQSEYLALKYNKKAFKNHRNIYKYKNKVNVDKNNIRHSVRNIRIDAVEKYAKNIIEPLILKYNYDNWYRDFKIFLCMKLMAVLDFETLHKKDVLLSIGYAQMFFHKNIKNIDELLFFIKQIWEERND